MSYSIYLLHGTILFILAYAFYQRVPLEWLFLPFLTCVVIASTIFYYLVEKPSIQLGRWLAKALGPTRGQPGIDTVTADSAKIAARARPLS
jgi:peptidoglycan/LPS O-acetylase OafA/YrhL